MEEHSTITISFPDLSPTEASRAAAELTEQLNLRLREEGLEGAATQKRTDVEAQDIGQIVQIVLSAPVILTLAVGLQKFLARSNRGRIKILKRNGESVDISEVESRHIEGIVSALKHKS